MQKSFQSIVQEARHCGGLRDRFLIDRVASYPDDDKILDDRVKERSFRGPPQLGQLMRRAGPGAALRSKPIV
jgi:hypothetical protein